MQFIMTARDMPKEHIHLNLRLRLEQQRLFSWSETCGLLDYDAENNQKVLESNAFGLHRSTVLELLVQMKVLFEDFEKLQIRYKRLETVGRDPLEPPPSYKKSEELDSAKDASDALVPLAPKRRKFIDKAIQAFKAGSKEGSKRLRWAAFDQSDFEQLLQRFSSLNDSITALLDMRLQDEIYSATQDTNRAVLQMHHDLADLTSLVKATLILTMEKQGVNVPISKSLRVKQKDNVTGLELLAQLARFKAFNEFIETDSSLDEATVELLKLGNPGAEKVAMEIDRSCISFVFPQSGQTQETRCEAVYNPPKESAQRVWIEWKDYNYTPGDSRPAPLIIERAQKLAALLHHRPKPKHFRVPHCLGYFDKAMHNRREDGDSSPISPVEDDNEYRVGFVFKKPEDVLPEAPPVSLLQLLLKEDKPRVTDRVALAKAIANCILYLHSVNWLHKGLRSHNIVFFRTKDSNKIDYSKPYISGFDFARPARPGEPTELPKDNIEFNLYRHPSTQNAGIGPREGYRKSFDIYSLGVVLVELAHWAPIERILDIDIKNPKPRPKIAAGVRERLLEPEQIAALGANMGEIYEKLVTKCIAGGIALGIGKGEDEAGDRAVAARLSMCFYEEVVRKLEEIRA
jgi:serine/threonine protein kinase